MDMIEVVQTLLSEKRMESENSTEELITNEMTPMKNASLTEHSWICNNSLSAL